MNDLFAFLNTSNLSVIQTPVIGAARTTVTQRWEMQHCSEESGRSPGANAIGVPHCHPKIDSSFTPMAEKEQHRQSERHGTKVTLYPCIL